jgi:O-methyltransferase
MGGRAFLKGIVDWAMDTNLLSKPRRWIRLLAFYILQKERMILLSYDDAERNHMIDLVNEVKGERPILLSDIEALQVVMWVKSARRIEGEMAEIGVYKGASAKLICEAKGDKTLHLFDTFEGIPEVGEMDSPYFYKGKYAAPMEDVMEYLKGYGHVYFYKGVFPATAKSLEDRVFSFVHVDVDTYDSTLCCLDYFYPRMNPGGFFVIHDYHEGSRGVKKAVDRFFLDKPEPIIEMPGSQCMLVKL